MENDILKLEQKLDELRTTQKEAKKILEIRISNGELDGKLEQLEIIYEILRERYEFIKFLEMEIRRKKYIMKSPKTGTRTTEVER